MKNEIGQVVGWIIVIFGITIIATAFVDFLTKKNTVVERQTPMVCYSPFDVYVTFDYELPDEQTLITSHGRIYNREDCREGAEYGTERVEDNRSQERITKR